MLVADSSWHHIVLNSKREVQIPTSCKLMTTKPNVVSNLRSSRSTHIVNKLHTLQLHLFTVYTSKVHFADTSCPETKSVASQLTTNPFTLSFMAHRHMTLHVLRIEPTLTATRRFWYLSSCDAKALLAPHSCIP